MRFSAVANIATAEHESKEPTVEAGPFFFMEQTGNKGYTGLKDERQFRFCAEFSFL